MTNHYVDRLMLTDPELVSSVDASMLRAGYRRIGLTDLTPEMVEAITCRDKPMGPEFRPEDDRLVYQGDENVLQVRKRGSRNPCYWNNYWGTLLIHATHVPDMSDFNWTELDQLFIPSDYLKKLIEAKRAGMPGIDFNCFGYTGKGIKHPFDPSHQYDWFFSDSHLLTNQHLSVERKLDTDITPEDKGKIITVLSTMLPYLADIQARYARPKAVAVRAIRAALNKFEESIAFQPAV